MWMGREMASKEVPEEPAELLNDEEPTVRGLCLTGGGEKRM